MTRENLAKEWLETDILVIGSEGTGARAALEAVKRGLNVTVLTKGVIGRSGATLTADADIDIDSRSAAELFGLPGDLEDSPEIFAQDMARESEYISDQDLVKIHCEDAPQRIKEIVDWGAKVYKLTKAPGHSYARGVWIPGTEFPRVFAREFKKYDRIRIIDNFMATDLLTNDGKVVGACGIHILEGEFYVIKAKAVVLCAGGAMRIYPHTTAPEELTGDGLAMAFRAGGKLVDMEFPMFLPYTMITPKSMDGVDFPYSLSAYTEAYALNRLGERYMKEWDPVRMERSTRDVNSIASMIQVLDGKGSPNGGTYISVAHLPENLLNYTAEWFPQNMSNWRYGGFNMKDFMPDLTKDAIEVSPAAHFWNGGIKINGHCETGVPGLFAAGEGTGSIMGANRISGNALTMTQVWGHRAGIFASEYAKQAGGGDIDLEQVAGIKASLYAPLGQDKGFDAVTLRKSLQALAWDKVGVVREQKGLDAALVELDRIKREVLPHIAVGAKSTPCNKEWFESIQLRNITLILEIVARSSLARTESRGALYRKDFPKTDNIHWLRNIVVENRDGVIEFSLQDANIKYNQPKKVIREYGLKG
jgi:succinate dehydrogenase/fumarate reductase flavoprotein subunit